MQIRNITNRSDVKRFIKDNRSKLGEIVRFGIVGVLATAIQYGVYRILIHWLNYNIANTIGYIVSFVFNFFASTHYTFKVQATAKRGAGFALSHIVNWLLQTVVLNLMVLISISQQWAPLPMFCICVPINFLLVRYFLKDKKQG